MHTASWIIPFSQRADRRVAHRITRYPDSVAYRLLCRNYFVNPDLVERAGPGAKRCRQCLEARDEL